MVSVESLVTMRITKNTLIGNGVVYVWEKSINLFQICVYNILIKNCWWKAWLCHHREYFLQFLCWCKFIFVSWKDFFNCRQAAHSSGLRFWKWHQSDMSWCVKYLILHNNFEPQSSYQYRKPHCGDKMVICLTPHNDNSYVGRWYLYISIRRYCLSSVENLGAILV